MWSTPNLHKYCMENDIAIVSYGPLSPVCRADRLQGVDKVMSVVDQIAKKYNVSNNVILLAWNLQRKEIRDER